MAHIPSPATYTAVIGHPRTGTVGIYRSQPLTRLEFELILTLFGVFGFHVYSASVEVCR